MQLFSFFEQPKGYVEEEHSEKVVPISRALVDIFDEEAIEHRRTIEDFKRKIGSHVSRI